MNIDIGLKLKELRILKGLTQEELADRAELSKGFISQLERNLTSPSIATLTDILQCLGSTLSEFFYEPAAKGKSAEKAVCFAEPFLGVWQTAMQLSPRQRGGVLSALNRFNVDNARLLFWSLVFFITTKSK